MRGMVFIIIHAQFIDKSSLLDSGDDDDFCVLAPCLTAKNYRGLPIFYQRLNRQKLFQLLLREVNFTAYNVQIIFMKLLSPSLLVDVQTCTMDLLEWIMYMWNFLSTVFLLRTLFGCLKCTLSANTGPGS